jgi:hypothetical protein
LVLSEFVLGVGGLLAGIVFVACMPSVEVCFFLSLCAFCYFIFLIFRIPICGSSVYMRGEAATCVAL